MFHHCLAHRRATPPHLRAPSNLDERRPHIATGITVKRLPTRTTELRQVVGSARNGEAQSALSCLEHGDCVFPRRLCIETATWRFCPALRAGIYGPLAGEYASTRDARMASAASVGDGDSGGSMSAHRTALFSTRQTAHSLRRYEATERFERSGG
jgi:hypothetical protein